VVEIPNLHQMVPNAVPVKGTVAPIVPKSNIKKPEIKYIARTLWLVVKKLARKN
jgi:hypothetical protein